MRIDLACQHFKFRLFLLDLQLFCMELLPVHIRNQLLDFPDHRPQIIIQLADFIISAKMLFQLKVSLRRLLHLCMKTFHPFGKGRRKFNHQDGSQRNADQKQNHALPVLLVCFSHNVRIGPETHDLQIIPAFFHGDRGTGHHIFFIPDLDDFLFFCAFLAGQFFLYHAEINGIAVLFGNKSLSV